MTGQGKHKVVRRGHKPQTSGGRVNVGAYDSPFSGVGKEYEPLGLAPERYSGVVLHEAGYWPGNYDWNFPSVYSPFWRIMYDYQPGHFLRFDDRSIPTGPDQVFVIPSHQLHDCMGDPPVPSLWFTFSCARQVNPHQEQPICLPLDPIMEPFLRQLPTAFEDDSEENRDRTFKLSLSFVIYTLSRPEIIWQPPLPHSIARVVAMMNEDPKHKWSISELAQSTGTSPDNFIRTFRRWMGSTPARYLTAVRLRESCQRLSYTDDTIEAIAAAFGFTDRFHFSRVFKKHTGITPVRYRKLHAA